MRREEICGEFRVSGRITGAAKPDVVRICRLPFRLRDYEDACGREGLFLRTWELSRVLEKPAEPPHSHAERVLLTLDGIYGQGELLLNGVKQDDLRPHMELDVTEMLREGACLMTLRFAPHFPVLYSGERGSDLPVETGAYYISLRSIYLLRIESVCAERDEISIRLYAYGAGKVRICSRLLCGEELLWTENFSAQVCVGSQTIVRKAELPQDRAGAVLRVTVDMGGEGCDECTVPYIASVQEAKSYAHFRTLPEDGMLSDVKQAGFDGIVLHACPHKGIVSACAELGLQLLEAEPNLTLRQILRPGSEYETKEGCLAVPMNREDDAKRFRQTQRLCEAAAVMRANGKAVHLLAYGRQKDAQDGLIDAQGHPRPALYALKNVLGRISLWAEGEKKLQYPDTEFSAELILLHDQPDGQAVDVEAQLFQWDGKELVKRIFPVCTKEKVQRIGTFRAHLPWNCANGLLLRLQCRKGGRLLAVYHAYYPFADENGNHQPFPKADLTECTEGSQRVLYNASDAVAMGVTILCGKKILLRHSAMLPGERIVLAQNGPYMVQYGNAIEKGGKAVVAQRILRGVFGNHNAAPADPQAGNRGC